MNNPIINIKHKKYFRFEKFIILAVSFIFFVQAFESVKSQNIIPAAYRTEEYFPLLMGRSIALVGNQASKLGRIHILDTLIKSGITIRKIFCPEHGFRGNIGAGEKVKSTTDSLTGIRIISLYGKHIKPKADELADVDVVLFDIQDVGVRFYTYISTLHYIMEACAENKKKLVLLDRPNPNGFYIDGPVLDMKYKSFAGIHPVPVVYGMTIGEYALMINGEKWLKNKMQCNLTVIACLNYNHNSRYILPERPSPNLPNMQAVYLYPSLALFEGTCINVGRGTSFPFQVFGHPQLQHCNFAYIPLSMPESRKPLHQNELCNGFDLRQTILPDSDKFTIKWLIFAYKNSPENQNFFNNYFYNLCGNRELEKQIINGLSEEEIKDSWKADIKKFIAIRAKYLIY